MSFQVPNGFLRGTTTSAHEVEGNNTNSIAPLSPFTLRISCFLLHGSIALAFNPQSKME
jgi:hypothetical protein